MRFLTLLCGIFYLVTWREFVARRVEGWSNLSYYPAPCEIVEIGQREKFQTYQQADAFVIDNKSDRKKWDFKIWVVKEN